MDVNTAQENKNVTNIQNGNSKDEIGSSKPNNINTFVFFDLETTGFEGNPRILELAMIAISRKHLLSMEKKDDGFRFKKKRKSSSKEGEETDIKNKVYSNVPVLPRVLHKYTKLYYPRKIIRAHIEEITGLSNYLLEDLPGFKKSSADGLKIFLDDLMAPVALVAHNGNGFDFPIVKAELMGVLDNLGGFGDYRFVDSLLAFRQIDAGLDQKEQELYKREVECQEIADMMEMAETFLDLPSPVNVDNEDSNCSIADAMSPNKSSLESTMDVFPESSYSTPVKTKQFLNVPKTPIKKKPPPQSTVTPTQKSHKSKRTKVPEITARRTLAFKSESKAGTYKQINIYNRLFGHFYVAHRAESDAQALLEICGHYGNNFVSWADENFKFLNDFKPRWISKKMVGTF